MASSRRRHITKSLVQQHGETLGCSACSHGNVLRQISAADQSKRDRRDSSDSECCGRSKSDRRRGVNRAAVCDEARHVETPSCWDEEMCGGQSNVFVSKESSHTPSSVVLTFECWGRRSCIGRRGPASGTVECLRTDVQLGETDNVSQQEYSTGHSPQVTLSNERKKCCVWRRKR